MLLNETLQNISFNTQIYRQIDKWKVIVSKFVNKASGSVIVNVTLLKSMPFNGSPFLLRPSVEATVDKVWPDVTFQKCQNKMKISPEGLVTVL